MLNKIKSLSVVFIPLLLLIACEGGKMPEKSVSFANIKGIPESTWKKLSEKKIYFGHQSVGYNIVTGLKDVMKENPQIKLNIVETYDSDDFNAGIFAHSRVGYNRDPKSKCDALAFFMKKGLGEKTDIAFFKYCYVDITAKTDVDKVFNEYIDIMSRLKKTYLKTTFIHVTVPLTSIQTGVKAWVKKIIGKPLRGYNDNIKRNQFNRMIRKEFGGKDAIFDLAKIESTFPDGAMATFNKDGETFYSIVPEYTNDSGHLNEVGRKIVAEQLLLLLSSLSE